MFERHLEVLAQGADVYTWNVDTASLDGFLEAPVFFPNYVPTGDSIQTLVLYSPTNGQNLQVTGALVYAVSDTETLMCEATGNVNLAVFDVPVLEMSFSGDPAPYCDGDVLTFKIRTTMRRCSCRTTTGRMRDSMSWATPTAT